MEVEADRLLVNKVQIYIQKLTDRSIKKFKRTRGMMSPVFTLAP